MSSSEPTDPEALTARLETREGQMLAHLQRLMRFTPCADQTDAELSIGLAGLALADAWRYALGRPGCEAIAKRLALALACLDPLRVTMSGDPDARPFEFPEDRT